MNWNIEIKINNIKVLRIHNILHFRNSNLKIFGVVGILSKSYYILLCYGLGYKHNFSQLALEGILLKITNIFLICGPYV